MTQDDYVVMKKTSREKLIKELKEVKKENQQLKKQKYDVVEYIKTTKLIDCESIDDEIFDYLKDTYVGEDLLRMLGEIDENN